MRNAPFVNVSCYHFSHADRELQTLRFAVSMSYLAIPLQHEHEKHPQVPCALTAYATNEFATI